MSQAKRFLVFMEFWFRQFYGSSKLGISATYNGRISFAIGKFDQVRNSAQINQLHFHDFNDLKMSLSWNIFFSDTEFESIQYNG